MIRKIIIAALAGVGMTLSAGASEMTAAHQVLTVMYFVQKHCPKLRVDDQMLNFTLRFTGEDIHALTSNSRKMQESIGMATIMATNSSSCDTIMVQFGPQGTKVPNLIKRR